MFNSDDFIELNREFVEIYENDIEASDFEARLAYGLTSAHNWSIVLKRSRVVILSSAGTGKTWEILNQCKSLREQGKNSFFIRLEYLANEWDDILFESFGDLASLNEAISKREKIWLFLDSIDEARLRNPGDFEKALRRLQPNIRDNLENTHIILTSRVSAWRPKDDAAIVNKLFSNRSDIESTSSGKSDNNNDLDIKYFTLRHLTLDQMRIYASASKVTDVELLISEIERLEVESLAGRPKDLDDLIVFWNTENRLGNRKEIVECSIQRKLTEYDLDRAERDPLTTEKSNEGAKKLAAAVSLTQQTKILVPDHTIPSEGISIQSVLDDWSAAECSALLSRPIFEPKTYGFVRFDHRDSKEFLAAKWFLDLMQSGQSRMRVEQLFFKDQYGIKVVVPSLRPILPWIAIFDQSIRNKIIKTWPEILLEGGDPSSLPKQDRQTLLENYCARYVNEQGLRLSVDISALKLLASVELNEVIRRLYDEYSDNEDIECLLLQMIKTGLIKDLSDIAIAAAQKNEIPKYNRLAAMRAVAAVCDEQQIISVCETISSNDCLKKREILAWFIETFGPKYISANTLMELIEETEPKARYSTDGLSQAIHSYVKSCPVEAVEHIVLETSRLIKKELHIHRRFFELSQENSWMLEYAVPACERLIAEKRQMALENPALSIMSLSVQSQYYDVHDLETNLEVLVPEWRELNNALFWYDVDDARSLLDTDKEERLTDWRRANFNRGLWNFKEDHFDEIIEWIVNKELLDDRLVALTLAFAIYREAGRKPSIRKRLKDVVKSNKELIDRLHILLHPPPMSADEKRWKRYEAQSKRSEKQRKKKTEEYHAKWREDLVNLINEIRTPNPLSVGYHWRYHKYLFDRMRESSKEQSRWAQSNWRELIPEFGQEIAEAMRDGLISFWRQLTPPIRCEGETRVKTAPSPLAQSGLEIEYRETENWPSNLTDEEAEIAVGYLLFELNGFPSWFEAFEKHFPKLTLNTIVKEAEWDLFHNHGEERSDSILSDIVWSASWFGQRIAPSLVLRLDEREPVSTSTLYYALRIISQCEAVLDERIANLCEQKQTDTSTPDKHRHLWYAAWTSVNPEPAISHLTETLASLDESKAKELAERYIVSLFGTRRDRGLDVREKHKQAKHLNDLYILMYQYIRPEDDIEHVSGEAYSPTSRDHAQDARRTIFNILVDIPGKETYDALRAIAKYDLSGHNRDWINSLAVSRAQSDVDDPWKVEKVIEFSRELERTPSNQRELFEVAINRFSDLKHDYENGDFSVANVVINITEEEKLRNYIASELQRNSLGRYSISQEDEMPNEQRTDIRFLNSSVLGMVPVELKIADKGWSGRDLFEKLRDQLCGDYMRDVNTKNGIYLLFYRGEQQRWQHPTTNAYLNFEELIDSLQVYAKDVISEKPEIENIEVIGIDLTLRGQSLQ